MAASPSSSRIFLLLLLSTFINQSTARCFTSIFSFGDSLADTGNLIHLSSPLQLPNCAFPPYGETFFGHPSGRCSDGRLIIDFIAQHLGLPLVVPYAAAKRDPSDNYELFNKGVNFAIVGATAMDNEFFQERGIHNSYTNFTLGSQLGWFKDLLPSLCHTSSECNGLLQNALVIMGEIGGNDYNYAFLSGESLDEIRSFVHPVIKVIASAINELINIGAVTILVPGNLPIGCSASYLAYFSTSNPEDYESDTGCLIWLNEFAKYHNKMLQIELNRIQELHPHVAIIYADYYNAAMTFYSDPQEYGFGGGALTACCGGGGPYNVNSSVDCGFPPSKACDDPSSHVAWDGLHLTEAAYSWISRGLLQGPFTIPPINTSCISLPGLSINQFSL